MPKTGDKATATGEYNSDCCGWKVDMKAVGNEFPPCPGCHKAATYTKA